MNQAPNILIFMTDQQRACSVLPGNPYKAKTPVLDAFRKESVTFNSAWCPSPHCCPSRASFFTGLMPSEHGVWNNVMVTNALSRGLKDGIRPWSMDLADAGYGLHFAGKWHVSNYQQPRDYGWQHIHPESMCHGEGQTVDEQERAARMRELAVLRNGSSPPLSGPRRPGEVRREGTSQYIHYGTIDGPLLAGHFKGGNDCDPFGDLTVTEAAVERLRELPDTHPWCLFAGTLGPHDPYIPPKAFLQLYEDVHFPLPASFDDGMADKPGLYRRTKQRFDQLTNEEHQEAIRHYLAFCSYEDWLFGKLLQALKDRGDYDNTVIIYLSDHGDYLGDHGLWCKGLPAFLSAYHIPAIMKVPGVQGGRISDDFVSLTDFGPTFLELAGVHSQSRFTGKSLLPLLNGNVPDNWREAVFFQSNGNETYGIQRSILTRKWRFVFNAFDFDELYDLENDPEQMNNLAVDTSYQPVIRDLYQQIWSFGLAHNESYINDYIMTALADYGPAIVYRD
jgi:arylsulfatase A-like enzyme